MKNHELLHMIGEVGEDHVLAAGNNVARPRFRWGALAACAACAALVLAAYPVYRAFNPPLHAYTVVEGGTLTTEGALKAPAGGIDIPGQGAPVPDPGQPPRGDGPDVLPGGAYVGGDSGEAGIDGAWYSTPGQDAPSQEKATAQYDGLMKNGGVDPAGPNPEWFGGAWIDNDWPDNVGRLTVAIVDGFRTPELEAQILDWCGGTGDVLFCGAKYALNDLEELMDPAVQALSGTKLSCGIGVDVAANCLGVDLYSDGAAIPDSVLAELARLDPSGDAIRVRLFTQSMNTLTDKGPAPDRGGKTEPVFDGARAEPNEEPTPTPVVEDSEWTMPAEEPSEIDELPEDKYDAPKAADAQPPEEYDIIEGE